MAGMPFAVDRSRPKGLARYIKYYWISDNLLINPFLTLNLFAESFIHSNSYL